MSTPAKRAGNKRYLQKYSTRTVRIPLSAVPEIDAELDRRGVKSWNRYILDLVSKDLGMEIGEDQDGKQ